MTLSKFTIIGRVLACAALLNASAAWSQDLTAPTARLDAFMKMRGNTEGTDTLADWHVTAFVVLPGQRPQAVFRLDGFNVGRFEKQADGSYRWLSREVAYYRDIATGRILSQWDNPFTKQSNDVLHVINDPVNLTFAAPDKMRPNMLNFNVRGDDVFLQTDVPLAYPNPLKPEEFPAESSGATYLASEHFMYFAKTADVLNTKLSSAPTTYSWLRYGPWLPWMKMGTQPGFILYAGQGKKVKTAVELDPVVRDYTEKNYPEFMRSPKEWVQPNETSWTYYKKIRGATAVRTQQEKKTPAAAK
jgi:hypothetical protein